MDVRCERCNTEYEFDDALVSGRGTTVKCTNCGHKFKIRRKDGDFSEDFWNVRTADGRTLVFTSLRELQRAIQSSLVERSDMLSRGGLPPKAIGQIPELSPFFEARESTKSLPRAPVSEPGSGTTPTSRPPPPPGSIVPQLAAPVRKHQTTRPDFPPSPEQGAGDVEAKIDRSGPMQKTLIGTGRLPDEPAAPAMRARMGSVPPPPTDRDPEPDTESYTRPADADRNVNVHVHLHTNAAAPHTAAVTRSPEAPPHGGFDLPKRAPALSDARPQDFDVPRAPIAGSIDLSSPLPPPTAPVRRAMSSYVDEDEEPMRGRSPSLPDAPASLGRRRSVGGFLVAVVVLVGVGILGAVWAKDHLGATLGASKTAPVATADPRVASFLSTGEKALVDGNLDLAKESFDKASALAEKDPHVLLDVARLAAIRADTAWLKSRLLPSDAADEHRATRDALAELSQAARRAAEDAIAVAPEDPAALRAKVDALRISGDPDAARGLVAKVAATGSVPESAYVLAALDLAAPEPLWSQVIGRLRTAASAEVGPGRARAALAYALARSGDVEGAKGEVDRLASMPRQHPLLPLLRAYTERAKSQPKVDAGALDAGTVAAADDPGAKPRDGKHGGEGGGGRPTGDGRQLVAQAEHARAKGDFDRASVLYAAALDRNPNDTEALSGLAAIAHARHDLNGARASYKRVLSINPSYVPALVGVGDVDWESGDRASAMKTYKEIVDRFPEGSYPPRVRQRLEAGGAPAPSPGASDPGGG